MKYYDQQDILMSHAKQLKKNDLLRERSQKPRITKIEYWF